MSKLLLSHPMSLTLRVTLLVGMVITVCLLLLSWIVQRSVNNHFLEQDIEELRVVASAVEKSLSNNFNQHNNFLYNIKNAVSGHHGVYFLVADNDKHIIFESPGPKLNILLSQLTPINKISAKTLHSWQENNTSYRGALLRYRIHKTDSSQQYFVIVATSINFHLNYLKQFEHNSRLVLFFALFITFSASWLAVRYGHKPLREISAQISHISSSQLHLRLDTTKLPIELIDLVAELNRMLSRIETSYIRLSHFSGDIAHELRTPVTNLMTQTQVALNRARSVEAYREILYSNLEEYERLAVMVSDMLFLAKSDNGLLDSTLVKLVLDEEILALFEYFDAQVQERQISLSLQSCSPSIPGDRAMLRRALSNLYSNAIHFTAAGNEICTTITEHHGWVQIDIANPGEVIPPQHLARIFDRFYRVDWARKHSGEGVGLGLAITRSIIEFHQGTISVKSDEKSTQFTLLLPSTTNH